MIPGRGGPNLITQSEALQLEERRMVEILPFEQAYERPFHPQEVPFGDWCGLTRAES